MSFCKYCDCNINQYRECFLCHQVLDHLVRSNPETADRLLREFKRLVEYRVFTGSKE